MKKVLRAFGIVIGVVLVAVIGLAAYYFTKYPDVGAPQRLTIARTPERLARGKYLANNVSVCIDCHSERDWKYFAAPVLYGTEGEGGESFSQEHGIPGSVYARNITPAGIGEMSDGELFRALTSGVRKNGDAMFPLMPYSSLNKLSDEDLYSIIAYIRSLPSIEHSVPESKLNFPMNVIVRSIPEKHVAQPEPDRTNKVLYGKYLVNAAGCIFCHSVMEKGEFVKGRQFAGGHEFFLTTGVVRSANITPDEGTGIGLWTEEILIGKFKQFASDSARTLSSADFGYQTIMPWTLYAGMTEDDLKAVFAFLRTIAPVQNLVVKYTAK